MNDQYVLTDQAIVAALIPAPEVRAPFDLGASIRAAVDRTPQRRRPLFSFLVPPASRPMRLLALALIAALLVLLGLLIAIGHKPPVLEAVIVDESMFRGGPARTGVVVGPGPRSSPSIAWDIGLQGAVYANSAAVVGGVVYVADAGGGLTAVGAEHGDRKWAITLPSAVNSSPAVADGRVVVGDGDGDVVAVDAASGALAWPAPVHTGDLVRSSPAIVNGVVYIGSMDGYLYAIDLATGSLRWKFDAGGAISRSPAVEGGLVYTGAAGGLVSAVDATTGSVKWQTPTGPGAIATPSVRDGLLMVTSGVDDPKAPHALIALDAATGAPRWQWASPQGQDVYVGSFDKGLVIANSLDGNVYALATPGGSGQSNAPGQPTLRWTFKTGGPVGSSLAIAGGVVYIAGGDHTVYAADEATGKERWRLAVTGQPGAIGVVGTRLYFGTDLGRLIAIDGTP